MAKNSLYFYTLIWLNFGVPIVRTLIRGGEGSPDGPLRKIRKNGDFVTGKNFITDTGKH